MKKFLSVLLVLMAAMVSFSVYAQKPQEHKPQSGHERQSFEQFMASKTRFLVQEMKLEAADSVRFVEVYQQLMKDKGALMHRYHQNRDVMHRIRKGEVVADSVYTRLVNDEAALQVEDAQLEQSYLERFSKVLTPRQLYDYRMAEKKFKNNFMKKKQ